MECSGGVFWSRVLWSVLVECSGGVFWYIRVCPLGAVWVVCSGGLRIVAMG